MSEAGFELRKWVTNDPSLRGVLELMDNDVPKVNSGCVDLPNLKENKQVLGLDWNVVEDEFVYSFEKLCAFQWRCDVLYND